MKINQLSEGLIKIPKYLILRCNREILKFISTTILKDSDSPELLVGMDFAIFKKYHVDFADYGEAYDLTMGETLAVDVSFHSDDVAYDTGKMKGNISFMIGATINDNKKKDNGWFIPKKNIVIINLYRVFRYLPSEYNMKDMLGSDKEPIDINDPMVKDFVESSVNEINRDISKFITSIQSTMEHELGHLFQELFFANKRNKPYDVFNPSDSPNEYITSEIEFHPTITSIVNNFVALRDNSRDVDRDLFKSLFDFVTTKKHIDPNIDMSGVDTESENRVKNGQLFFSALKEKDIKMWKIAVKYLYTELERLDIL